MDTLSRSSLFALVRLTSHLGMFLWSALTVARMVTLAQHPGSRWLAVLISADGKLGGGQA